MLNTNPMTTNTATTMTNPNANTMTNTNTTKEFNPFTNLRFSADKNLTRHLYAEMSDDGSVSNPFKIMKGEAVELFISPSAAKKAIQAVLDKQGPDTPIMFTKVKNLDTRNVFYYVQIL